MFYSHHYFCCGYIWNFISQLEFMWEKKKWEGYMESKYAVYERNTFSFIIFSIHLTFAWVIKGFEYICYAFSSNIWLFFFSKVAIFHKLTVISEKSSLAEVVYFLLLFRPFYHYLWFKQNLEHLSRTFKLWQWIHYFFAQFEWKIHNVLSYFYLNITFLWIFVSKW